MKSLDKFPGGRKAKAFDPDLYGFDPRDQVAAKSEHTGLFGIEIELEGTRLPEQIAGGTWAYHADGSLRHPNGVDRGGAEYVLARPLDLEPAKDAVRDLFDQLRTRRADIANSYRTSTHVHVNMAGVKLNALASFVTYWTCFEDVLASYCGTGRCGNLFALRMSDSAHILDRWIEAFRTGYFEFNREHRYLALNPACLGTFGSLEVRTMRGIDNAADLTPWLDALARLRERSIAVHDPRTIAGDFSELGPIGVLRQVFDGLPILDDLLAQSNVESRVRAGFRLVQPLIYSLPWDDVLPEITKVFVFDPFAAPKPPRPRPAPRARMRFDPGIEPEFN